MTRSLYARLLVGFGVILALTLVAIAGTVAVLAREGGGPENFIRGTLTAHRDAAWDLVQAGQTDAAARYLRRLDAVYDGQHYLLDPAGRDLVDGTDRSALAANAAPPGPPLGGERVISHPSPDGQCRLLVVAKLPSLGGTAPYFLWIPVAVALACLLLAYHLIRPLRRLRDAVVRFGGGDLAARAGVRRRDEIGDLAAEFDRMADRIEKLVTAERRLLQDVSHELRSPLARLTFAVELADLARARKEVRRLADLVAELVELTRAEGEPAAAPLEPLALDALLTEAVDDARIEAEAKGCRIESAADAGLVVRGHAQLLHRAVENVLRNAVRFTPPGTAVVVRATAVGDAVEVRVRDHGPGVPADMLEAIFAPFVRVDADRSRPEGGVGLGLAIARRAVAVHAGTITAHNRGPGLEVVLRLPLAGRAG